MIKLDKPFLFIDGGSLYIEVKSIELKDFTYNYFLDANIHKEIISNDDALDEFVFYKFNHAENKDEIKEKILKYRM